MNIVPIFVHTPHVAETCPSCNKPEDTVLVCNHCGHKYIDEESASGWTIFWFITIVVFVVLFLLTFMSWAFEATHNDKYDKTFWQYLVDGAKHLWKRIFTKLI